MELKKLLGSELPPNTSALCYVHPGRVATRLLRVPCAPEGGHMVCNDCATEEGIKGVFAKYQSSHGKTIKAFKQVNVGS